MAIDQIWSKEKFVISFIDKMAAEADNCSSLLARICIFKSYTYAKFNKFSFGIHIRNQNLN